MQTVHLDISNKRIIPTIYAKQKDVGRKFKAVITDYNGVPRNISEDEFFSVWYDGKSGSGNYTTIGENSAFYIENNTVIVELITQMLSIPGEGDLSLVLHGSDGSRIGLWNISYYVEEIPGEESEEAKQYYDAFSEDVRNAKDMLGKSVMKDGSTTMTGDLDMGTHRVKNVADPEEDGDAVPLKYAEDHFAPAGYGLGERAFNAPGNDANQITKCGFFRAYVNTPTGDWWTIQQEDLYGDGTYMIQKASCFAYAFVLHAERMVVDGKFYEWEWLNPPMIPGVEYRTTERWNGNVVYAKLVNCGTAINDATVTLEGVAACVRFIGYLSYPSETDPCKQLPIWSGSTIGTGYHAEIMQPASPYCINKFIIKTDSNADGFGNGGYNWYVHAWYTKD